MNYPKTLRVEGNKVISYTTHVATIKGGQLLVHGYWSVTTSKHINMIAKDYRLVKVDAPLEETKAEPEPNFKALKAVLAMGEIFCDTQSEKTNWKVRMLKAGLGDALSIPEDWNQLSEDEKEKRINKCIEILKS